MGLPPGKVPPDGAFRRMCSGQCAEIWRYVTRHVHHQRNVKKIRGNLLWYQHLEEAEGKPSGSEPEQERRQQLAQGVARLRGELQQLDLQMETAQREVMADEVSLEAAQERIRDAQRRSLLLKAYAARLAKERQQLQGSVAQLRGRLEQLKDISRKAKVELTVGGKLPDLGFAGLEPEVLQDKRGAAGRVLPALAEHGGGSATRAPVWKTWRGRQQPCPQSGASYSAKHSCTGRGAGSRWISHHFLQRLSRFPWRMAPLSGTQLSRARGMNRESAKRVKPPLARKWLLASHLLLLARPYTPTRSLLLHSHPQLSAERGSE
nr:HAUS augmin-like complex subunit 5 isoform X3 [Caretta caretta]